MTDSKRVFNNRIRPEQQSRRELADLLVDYLTQLGVEFVFGVPGGAIEHFYSALARGMRRGHGPRPIVARHETGAAFMADGYYRETGKLGVCCSTTGPGTTNLITGVASAYENQIPMLVISGQTALSLFGRGASQDSSCTGIDTVGLLRYCTRYSTLISHPDQFERKLTTAIMTAFESPYGPVHISVPWNILQHSTFIEKPSYDLVTLTAPPSTLDIESLNKLYRHIERAKKLVFVIGGGCGEAISSILELASLLNATIFATHHGKGFINPYHPLFRGIVGFAGHRTTKEILSDPEVDTILAIGTALGETDSGGWDSQLLLNERLIHIDAAERHLTRSPMARLQVRGRILSIFEYLVKLFKEASPTSSSKMSGKQNKDRSSLTPFLPFPLDAEAEYSADSTPIKPQRLMRELSRLFPTGTRFLSDTGNVIAWAVHYLHPFWEEMPGPHAGSGGVFRHSAEFVSMTWSLGASIGTALGNPNKPVVCLIGDGSLLMSGQEITVAVQEKLTIIFVVLNDAALGMVKHGQRLTRSEPIAFELPDIDYSAYARVMGADGHVIHSPQDLLNLDIAAICRKRGPTLLDVRIDPEEVPPFGARMQVLGAIE